MSSVPNPVQVPVLDGAAAPLDLPGNPDSQPLSVAAAERGGDPRPLRVDAERNLRRLLDAAALAFAEHGLSVSVAEIARRAGVGKGTVFRRFPTKEHLVSAILCDRLEEVAVIGAALQESDDAALAMLEFMRTATRLQARDRGFFDAIAGVPLAYEGMLADAKLRLLGVTADLLARAQQQGAIRADVTCEDIMLLVCACSQAAAPFHSVAPELWGRYLDVVFDGLRAEAAHQLSHPPPTMAQLGGPALGSLPAPTS